MDGVFFPLVTLSVAITLMGPIDSLENALLRLAAISLAGGAIYRLLLPPARGVKRFFTDHHDAVEAVKTIEVKVGTIETKVETIERDVCAVRSRQDEIEARLPNVLP